MTGQRVPEIVCVGNDVDDTRRQNLSAQLTEPQCSQRCRGRGFGDNGVASEQGWSNLDHQQEQRKIPRRDRCNYPKRRALLKDAYGVSLAKYLFRQLHCGECADHCERSSDLTSRVSERLALFLCKQSR